MWPNTLLLDDMFDGYIIGCPRMCEQIAGCIQGSVPSDPTCVQ